MKRYNPLEIEPKWQKLWDDNKVYQADLSSSKPKYIAMSMFNYPSGAGIHIGHAMNYTISDVKARFKRQQGYESYHPVGWDAFGLPAENYAIKAGVSPQASMARIIPSYHTQYKAMGWSNDWSREISTHEPEYYRWTQWIFAQMYKKDLAYQDSRMQWWCEKDNTVLANEQIVDGKCWRHDGPDDPLVEQREVKQWFFKITEYADELLDAIDELDWTNGVKLAQKNWIGRKTGINITYKLTNSSSDEMVTVFTTRPDTNFGATFIVLAPEHPLARKIIDCEITSTVGEPDIGEIEKYVKQSLNKSEVERQEEGRKKTGVFTGFYAKNELNGNDMPIWVSDFVLGGFGTGAVVGVPGHDLRDFQFAQTFGIPIVRVVVGNDNDTSDITRPEQVQEESGTMVNSEFLDGLDINVATEKVMDYIVEKGWGERVVNYKMRDWSVSRQRYWGAPIPMVHCEKCGNVLIPDEDLPVVLPELKDFQPSGDGRSALARATDWLNVECPNCGGPAERETDTLDTYIDSSWYMFRYLDPRNTEKIFDTDIVNKWTPIDFYNGGDHATAHLLYARFITRFFTKLGLMENPEPFKQMLYNGKVVASDGTPFSKSKGNGIDPLEIIGQGYGADALRTYLMFAAPLEFTARWDPQGVPGTHRFLNRVWNLVQEYLSASAGELDEATRQSIRRSTHRMIHKITVDIEESRYNTAIAAAMAQVNELYKLKVDNLVIDPVWQEALESLIACIAPFAPHVADELWHELGNETSVQKDSWPKWDPELLVDDTVTIVVQINGKVRAEVKAEKDADKQTLENLALANERVQELLGDKKPTRVVVVPGRLVNIVI